MLRLQPSEIILTQGEIIDFKNRCGLRRARVSLAHSNNYSHMRLFNSSTITTLPRIRRGPERSRDESLTEFSPNTSSASVACSDNDDASDYPDSGHGSVDVSPDLTVFGFDQKGLTISHHDYHAYRPVSSDMPFSSSPRQACTNRHPSNSLQLTAALDRISKLASEKSSGTLGMPMSSESALSKIRDQNSGRRVIRRPQQSRRFRPRSVSDPGEPPMTLLALHRRRERRAAEATSPKSTTASEQLISLTPPSSPVGSPIKDDTPVAVSPAASRQDRNSVSGQYIAHPAHAKVSSFPLIDTNHARYQSLPNSPADGLQPLLGFRSRRDELGQWNTTPSALLDAMQNRLSPLEELASNALAWTAELPLRTSMRPRSVVQLSSSEELDIVQPRSTIDSDHGAAIYEGFTSGRDAHGAKERQRPSHHLHDIPETIQRTHGADYTGMRASRWRRGAGATVEFAVGRGGRPSTGPGQRTIIGGPRRRLPSAEQENEGEMETMEQERRWFERRSEEERGGVLERTPPGEGRFERFL